MDVLIIGFSAACILAALTVLFSPFGLAIVLLRWYRATRPTKATVAPEPIEPPAPVQPPVRPAPTEERFAELAVAYQHCKNELEVELKCIGPLFDALGYRACDFTIRVSCPLISGAAFHHLEADWVVRRPGSTAPFIVVEAKGPTVGVSEAVIAQARRYATILAAKYFLATNGQVLVLFERDSSGDVERLRCNMANLREHWVALAGCIGVPLAAVQVTTLAANTRPVEENTVSARLLRWFDSLVVQGRADDLALSVAALVIVLALFGQQHFR